MSTIMNWEPSTSFNKWKRLLRMELRFYDHFLCSFRWKWGKCVFVNFAPGAALGYLGVRIRLLSKLKNTPKALISGQKKHPYFNKNAEFFHEKKNFFYQNTDIGRKRTHILTSDFIILCEFSVSKWRQQTRKPSHFGSHSASEPRVFRGLQGDFDPHTSYLGTRKYHSFTKSRTCGDLEKRPLLPLNT